MLPSWFSLGTFQHALIATLWTFSWKIPAQYWWFALGFLSLGSSDSSAHSWCYALGFLFGQSVQLLMLLSELSLGTSNSLLMLRCYTLNLLFTLSNTCLRLRSTRVQQGLDALLLSPTRSWCCARRFLFEFWTFRKGSSWCYCLKSLFSWCKASWLAYARISTNSDSRRLAFSWSIPARSCLHTVNSDALWMLRSYVSLGLSEDLLMVRSELFSWNILAHSRTL